MEKKRGDILLLYYYSIFFWCIIFSLFLLPVKVNASGIIVGHIINKQTKQGITGATVIAFGANRSTISNNKGNFIIQKLLPGSIKLIISSIGYKTDTILLVIQDKEQQELTIALEELVDNLQGVTIYSNYVVDGSEKKIFQLQKLSIPIVDFVSEETIDRTSDLTIADVTRRVNGLSTTTERAGEPIKTIIRGIDPKYNYSLVNGFKIPSPADKIRYVPLSFFPADIVQRLEVYKNLTPDMEGDAIGGVVNLVLRNAPEKPTFKANIQTGFNSYFFNQPYLSFNWREVQKKSPYEIYGSNYYAKSNDFTKSNLSFTDKLPGINVVGNMVLGKRFLQNKLGVLLATDYQKQTTGSSNFFIAQNSEPQLDNAPGLTNFYLNKYTSTTIRESIHTMLDYKFSNYNTISLYQVYIKEKDIDARNRTDTSLTQGRSIPGTGSIKISNRSRLHEQALYSAGFIWNAKLSSKFSINLPVSYSIATGLYPDWSELSSRTSRIENPNGQIIQAPLLLEPLTRIWLSNRERDFCINPRLEFKTIFFKKELGFTLGGLYRNKYRNNFYNAYLFQPAITSNQGQPFVDIFAAVWSNNNAPQNPLGDIANPNTYSANENINAAYFSFNLKTKKTAIVSGLRYEATKQNFSSSINPSVTYGKEGAINYFDFLPSIQIKHQLSKNSSIKASWYKSISRPALYDITFYSINYEDYTEAGNPFLKRAIAGNFDIRYELYTNGLDQFLLGAFYKQIKNPYEKTLLNTGDVLYPLAQQGLSYTPANALTSQVRNAAFANILGLEFSGTKYFGKIGIQASYTFTYSRIEQASKFKTRENPGNTASNIITISKNEIRPLQGQSPHLANLGIIYKDPKIGITARTSAIYTGRRIFSSSGWYGLDYWQRGYWLLDAYIEKKIAKSCKIYIKANNIFNTSLIVDLLKTNPSFMSGNIPAQENSGRITVMKQIECTNYFLGIQLTF
jgi:outer membrane receptor for ferrienterochelin and colicin